MDVINCKSCGKLVVRQSSDLCIDCIRKDDTDFEKVRESLRERRKIRTSPNDVEIGTGVSLDTVFRYMKEGRLLIYKISQMEIMCESCGKASRDGTICAACRDRLRRDLAQARLDSSDSSKPSTYRT
jgi:ribosomal protein L32